MKTRARMVGRWDIRSMRLNWVGVRSDRSPNRTCSSSQWSNWEGREDEQITSERKIGRIQCEDIENETIKTSDQDGLNGSSKADQLRYRDSWESWKTKSCRTITRGEVSGCWEKKESAKLKMKPKEEKGTNVLAFELLAAGMSHLTNLPYLEGWRKRNSRGEMSRTSKGW